jgi:methionine synthase II (cobalamin-independent)
LPDENIVVEPQEHVDTKRKPNIRDSDDAIKDLRAENAEHRIKAKEATARAEAAEKTAAETQQRVSEIERKARERTIRSELKSHATTFDMNDPIDALRYIKDDQIEFDDSGDIINGATLLQQLKESKPYLFGNVTSSSTARAPVERREPAGVKDYSDMSDNEKKAFNKKYGIK